MALDFKSATLYTLRVVLHTHEDEALQAALATRMDDAGSFFEDEAIVIDASAIDPVIDWAALLAAFRRYRLHPVGVVAQGANLDAARSQGLALVEPSAPPTRPASAPADDAQVPAVSVDQPPAQTHGDPASPEQAESPGAPPAPPAVAPAALVIQQPLRSGQRVYARDTDLIVIGMVSQGAEVIADGNIHVYGPLRGKAMAGARGDASARIFTTRLDAELVAIAGVYRVIETRLDDSLRNRPTVIRRQGDTLDMRALDD